MKALNNRLTTLEGENDSGLKALKAYTDYYETQSKDLYKQASQRKQRGCLMIVFDEPTLYDCSIAPSIMYLTADDMKSNLQMFTPELIGLINDYNVHTEFVMLLTSIHPKDNTRTKIVQVLMNK